MTLHIDARDIAGVTFRAPRPLAAARDLVGAGARAGWRRFLEGLHRSRRQQAAIELAKHRYLIYDPTTGVSFGIDTTGAGLRAARITNHTLPTASA